MLKRFSRFLCVLTALLQYSTAMADAPLIWAPGADAKLLNSRGLLGSDSTVYPKTYLGPKNYAALGSSRITGWDKSGTAAVTLQTTAASLPEPLIGTGIAIAPGSIADYVFYNWKIDPSDSTVNQKLTWSQLPAGGYASGNSKLEIYSCTVAWTGTPATTCSGTLTKLPLTTDSSGGVTSISAAQNFATVYTAPSYSVAPYMQLRIVTVTATGTLTLSSVYTGPGSSVQGAVVGPWQSYTPTIGGTGAATITTNAAYYRRVGDSVEVMFQFGNTVAGSGSSQITVGLPNGYSLNTSAITGGPIGVLGAGNWVPGNASTESFLDIGYNNGVSSTAVLFTLNNSYVIGSQLIANSFVSGRFTVPVNELAGSGTVNLAQNDVEYLSNSSSSTTSDSTSFAYGPGGSPVRAYAPAGTASVTKRVRASRPILGKPVLQFADATGLWVPSEQRIGGFVSNVGATTFYGFRVVPVNSTDIDVTFFSAYDSGGGAWSALAAAGWNWRIVVENPGQAVPFASYVPGQSSGLVPSAGLPGRTDGGTIAVGAVGENYTDIANNTYSATQTNTTQTSRTLPAGVWLVLVTCFTSGSASPNWAGASFSMLAPTYTGQNGLDYTSAPGGSIVNGDSPAGQMSKIINSAIPTAVVTRFSGTRTAGTVGVSVITTYTRIN